MSKESSKTKPATVAELLAVIAECNKAHDFALKIGALKPGLTVKNPFLDALYVAATNAAVSLAPLMKVEVATKPINAEAQRPDEKK